MGRGILAAVCGVGWFVRKVLLVCTGIAAFSCVALFPRRAATQGETSWLVAGGLRLKTEIFRSAKLSDEPALIMVLHGDSPFGPPSYQYTFGEKAVERIGNVIVAALLRPGYCDGSGDCSAGERGLTTGDNYTAEVIGAVADATEQLKKKYRAGATIIVGHSGGAAISADLIGKFPTIVEGAVLVSCPCDVPVWRRHMFEMQDRNPIWLKPIRSLSPMDLAEDASPHVHVRMIVGRDDNVAPPDLTNEYAGALRKRGTDVEVTIVPGLAHDILLEPLIFDQLQSLLETIQKARGASGR
jgi:pimeloyl-ACP methyl ester carboxylesterase